MLVFQFIFSRRRFFCRLCLLQSRNKTGRWKDVIIGDISSSCHNCWRYSGEKCREGASDPAVFTVTLASYMGPSPKVGFTQAGRSLPSH